MVSRSQIRIISLLWSLILYAVLGINAQTVTNPEGYDQIIIKLKNKIVFDSTPLVVNLDSNNKSWNKIKYESGDEISLNILVEQATQEWSGFRVFLNLPKADAATSIKVPEYVGSAAFYSNTVGEKVSFTFELNRIKTFLKEKQLRLGNPITLSIVPIRRKSTKLPKMGLTVKQIVINSAPK